MKLIIAIIQPSKVEAVKEALNKVEVFRLTMLDVRGFGRQKGHSEVYRGHELTVNLLHKVLSINYKRCTSRSAQGYMEHRSIFGDVDFVAPKHSVNPCSQAGFLRQLKQELERLISNAILRVIEVYAYCLSHETLTTA